MKTYNVSRVLPLKTLVRAYELWCSTDLSQPEIALALGVSYRTLKMAIVKAERKGLYAPYKPSPCTALVIKTVLKTPGLNIKQITERIGFNFKTVQKSAIVAFNYGFIGRRKLNRGDHHYVYY